MPKKRAEHDGDTVLFGCWLVESSVRGPVSGAQMRSPQSNATDDEPDSKHEGAADQLQRHLQKIAGRWKWNPAQPKLAGMGRALRVLQQNDTPRKESNARGKLDERPLEGADLHFGGHIQGIGKDGGVDRDKDERTKNMTV